MNVDNSEHFPFVERKKATAFNPSLQSNMNTNYDNKLKDSMVTKLMNTLTPPIDRYRLVFFIFILHGLGTLMPWNMFITAKHYFVDFKLSSNSTEDGNTSYSKNFLPYLTFASQVPNLLFNWLNIFVNLGGDLTKRIVYSILIEIVIFIITIILAMLDSSDWPGVFFWITMITVVILNMANGIYQNTIYGMVATLPVKYTGAVVLGSNLSGLFASIISICSTYIFNSKRTSAIYYFVTAMLVLLICFDTYFALPLIKFYRHYELLRQNDENQKKKLATVDDKTPYFAVFKEALPQMFNIFFTFFVTLSVFPSVHSDIKQIDSDFIIPSKSFVDITCFLTFNLFAMLGSLTTSWIQWPKPKFLTIPVLMRVVFVPLLIFCNYHPKDVIRNLPVIINNDWIYWLIAVLMAFSSGYLSSLGMMYAPQAVRPKYQTTAGMFAAAMLITGIFSGVLLSFILPTIV